MEQETRNKLQRATQQIRRLLEEEFAEQLEGTFDILASGKILPSAGKHLDARQQLIRQKLVKAIEHMQVSGKKPQEAVLAYMREAAFTFLNRFVALRMMEARRLVQECVSRGDQSSGFKEFCGLAPGLAVLPDGGYRLYLECLCDELSVEIKVLFNRRDSASLLWPRRSALTGVLEILAQNELTAIWEENETIGWVYQYYNDEAERKKMREESSAPRNSRELAVRNQFFTPRYVVQFLTDNTLGRIWYEMTHGETALRDRCRFLVRRPTEIFLADPEVTYDSIFGEPEDGEYYGIPSGCFGDFSDLPDDGPDSRWISVALPPREFPAITGEPYEPFADDRLGRLIDDITQGRDNPDASSLPLVWAAASCFTLNDGGGAYSIDPWQKLWAHFCKVARQPTPKTLSQEDLLKQPVFIPHRPLKDPREIRLLDPACGSMHFGLYAFELFSIIYDEAWEIARGPNAAARAPATFAPFVTFASTFANKALFLREVPRLIIQHNIHGIDIDPRAAQIANLAIWLRAQRSWHESGIDRKNRPQISRSNIVCAEPMPGEKGMLREFVEQQFPVAERPAFAFLLEKIFDRMSLAGEAGSLLRIEEEIRIAVAEAHSLARKQSEKRQKQLFTDTDQPRKQQMEFDLRGLTDDEFWNVAEQRIYDALEAYAAQAENGGGFQRRLFADDAAQGFSFIDLCRKRYDVVVMNPPFGELAEAAAAYLDSKYPACKSDYYPCFIERGTDLLAPLGSVGAITNRTGFFLDGLSEWRKQFFEPTVHIEVFCDLGLGVLDALVETAAYVIRRHGTESERMADTCVCFPMLDVALEQRAPALLNAVGALSEGLREVAAQLVSTKSLLRIPNSPLAYRAHTFFVRAYAALKPLESDSRKVRVTNPKGDDFRFVRTRWEVPAEQIGRVQRWVFLSKGGEYSNYYADIHLLIDWDESRQTYRGFVGTEHRPMTRPASLDHFFCKGLTFSRRTASRFSPRILPAGCIFTDQGPVIFSETESDMLEMLAITNSRIFQGFLEMFLGSGDATSSGAAARHYEAGVIRNIPTPRISAEYATTLARNCIAMFSSCREPDVREEISSLFTTPLPGVVTSSIRSTGEMLHAERCHRISRMLRLAQELEAEVAAAYGIPTEAEKYLDTLFGPDPLGYSNADAQQMAQVHRLVRKPVADVIQEAINSGVTGRFITIKSYAADRQVEVISHFVRANADDIILAIREKGPESEELLEIAEDIFSYLLGCVFGRWDIRYASGERPVPELPDPFAPLPACPPGMLQGDDGLPLSAEAGRRLRSESRYPLEVTWGGILVDDPEHSLDVSGRVRQVLEVLWSDRSDTIELEACDLLGVKSLSDWFRRPTGFFADHLKRYSKSRRKAPIYWPLSTPTSSYTVWLYYHRFSKDTFFKTREIVGEKLKYEQTKLERLKSEYGEQPTRSQTKELETQEKIANEIKAMYEEVDRIAPLWNPNLNDGVLINFAPLWRLVPHHKAWQKECKECWDSLVAGELDWAHLALHLWPERVVPRCHSDRSLAIAHDVEELLWIEDGKSRPIKSPNAEIDDQRSRRRSNAFTAFQKAMDSLAEKVGDDFSASEAWNHLSDGDWDDSDVAMLLWPRRVVLKCFEDEALAKTHRINDRALSNVKQSGSNDTVVERVIDYHEKFSCSTLLDSLKSEMSRAEGSFAEFWEYFKQANYDYSELSLRLWPDRIVNQCTEDIDVAREQSMLRFFWVEGQDGQWRRRRSPEKEIADEIGRRNSPAVKASLESLLSAPAPAGNSKSRRRKATT